MNGWNAWMGVDVTELEQAAEDGCRRALARAGVHLRDGRPRWPRRRSRPRTGRRRRPRSPVTVSAEVLVESRLRLPRTVASIAPAKPPAAIGCLTSPDAGPSTVKPHASSAGATDAPLTVDIVSFQHLHQIRRPGAVEHGVDDLLEEPGGRAIGVDARDCPRRQAPGEAARVGGAAHAAQTGHGALGVSMVGAVAPDLDAGAEADVTAGVAGVVLGVLIMRAETR